MDAMSSPPSWLTAALSAPSRSVTGEVGGEVGGVPVHRREWGDPGMPAMVLLHGGGAHAGWWRVVAGLLADRWHVIAPDLTGHGRSAHRSDYTFTGWVGEVLAHATDAGADRPVVVGHSMCGVVAMMAGSSQGDRLAGVAMVDTPLDIPAPEQIGHAEQIMARRRTFPTVEAATGRFRLLPDQPVAHPVVLEDLAREAVVPHADGWTWAFDPGLFAGIPDDRPRDVGAVLAATACPAAVVVAGRSPVIPTAQRDRLAELCAPAPAAGPPRLLRTLDDGHHHLMLDHPRELARTLHDLAAPWAPDATP